MSLELKVSRITDTYGKICQIVERNALRIENELAKENLSEIQKKNFTSSFNSKKIKSYFQSNLADISECFISPKTISDHKRLKKNISDHSKDFYLLYFEEYTDILITKIKQIKQGYNFNQKIDFNKGLLISKKENQYLIHPNCDPQKQKLYRTSITKITEKIKQFQFIDFVKKNNLIELLIYEELITLFHKISNQYGYDVENNLIINKKEEISFVFTNQQEIFGGKKICILLRDELNFGILNTTQISCNINQIGRIQEVELLLPKRMYNFAISLLSSTNDFLSKVYLQYEKYFIQSVYDLNKQIFNNAYTLIRKKLAEKNKDYLIDKFWLLLANGQEDFMIYFFDNLHFENTLYRFKSPKNNKPIGKSPIEVMIELMTKAFPFKKSVAIQSIQAKKPVSMPLRKLKYISDLPFLFDIERKLLNSSSGTGYVISKRDYFLSIACASENNTEIITEIKLIQKEIEDLFKNQIENFSLYLSELQYSTT